MKKLMLISFFVLFLFSCSKKNTESTEVTADTQAASEQKKVEVNTNIEGNSIEVFSPLGEKRTVDVVQPSETTDGLAYIIGYNATSQLASVVERIYSRTELSNNEIGSLLQGIIDKIAGKDLDWDYMNDIGQKLNEDNEKKLEEIRSVANNYYESLKTKQNMKTTESGLIYEILEANENGKSTGDSESVNVDYKMEVFVSDDNFKTVDRGEGVDFPLTSLIEGAAEGIKLMKEGERFVFYIVPELGYGKIQVSNELEADSYLRFEVKLNKVNEVENATQQ